MQAFFNFIFSWNFHWLVCAVGIFIDVASYAILKKKMPLADLAVTLLFFIPALNLFVTVFTICELFEGMEKQGIWNKTVLDFTEKPKVPTRSWEEEGKQ